MPHHGNTLPFQSDMHDFDDSAHGQPELLLLATGTCTLLSISVLGSAIKTREIITASCSTSVIWRALITRRAYMKRNVISLAASFYACCPELYASSFHYPVPFP